VAYYNEWLQAQAVCIGNVEEILSLPHGQSDPNCVASALEVVRRNYLHLLKHKDKLKTMGVDLDVILYIDKQAELITKSMQSIATSLDQWPVMNSNLAAISAARKKMNDAAEPALRSTYGNQVKTWSEALSEAKARETQKAEAFRATAKVEGLLPPLMGLSFINTQPGASSWRVENNEYVSGRVISSVTSWNLVIYKLEMNFRGSRSGNSGGIRVALVIADDPEGNSYIPVFAKNIPPQK
jgi:hypothetical protein